LLQQEYRVQPFYVRSRLFWERAELTSLRVFLRTLAGSHLQGRAASRLGELTVFDLPLGDVYGEHWSTNGRDVPDAASPDDAVYLPGRNALLTIKPMLWCAMRGIEQLALAILAANPFSDATDLFFDAQMAAMRQATGREVRIFRPFSRLEKADVLTIGRDLPLELTFSCIAPVDGRHCGRCNKCAERKRVFAQAQMKDPTSYV
jgi:7-cyano-7-deazaguanine synthase